MGVKLDVWRRFKAIVVRQLMYVWHCVYGLLL